jgi:hypothetical protein
MTTTLPARLAECAICNGTGQIMTGTACPVCQGIGMTDAAAVADYRARLAGAALAGAVERAKRLGAAGVDLERRRAEQARQDAARHYELAESAARRAESALSQLRALTVTEQAARAEHAQMVSGALAAFAPRALPAPQPPTVNPQVPGGTRDPIIYADSIACRELDVWGVFNLAGGGTGLMVNPMNTTGDMIYGNPASTPVRLPIGAANQVLTVIGGVPTWQNSAAGFANPMITGGQLITSGGGGTPVAIGPGAAGTLVYSNAGTPAFGQGPLTAAGDLLIGAAGGSGSTPARLPVGANGQVLTVSGGSVLWANSAAGFANPMTTKGDIIYGQAGGAATRLPIGGANQVLTSVSGIPGWTAITSTMINPSGDVTGATDTAAIQAANNSFVSAQTGGRIQLGPGAFYITAVTINAQCVAGTSGGNGVSVWGQGSATTVFVVGNGTGISCHRSSGYGAQFGNPAQMTTSQLKFFVLDGTNATNGAIGLDWGDGWGYDIDLTVVNFTATNSIAVQQINRNFWTEKATVRLNLMNNLAPLVITRTGGGDHSGEYCDYYLSIFINTDAGGTVMQNGVQVLGGINQGGCHYWARGNVSSLPAGWNLGANPIALFNWIGNDGSGDWSRLYFGELHFKIEGNPGVPNTGNYPYGLYLGSGGGGQNEIKQCSGRISHSAGNSNLNGGQFSFRGQISGDSYLQGLSPGPPGAPLGNGTTVTGAPTFPGLGVTQPNYASDQLVTVLGGTVSGISISGQATGATSGTFFVCAGGTIVVNGTVAPTTYSWVPGMATTY